MKKNLLLLLSMIISAGLFAQISTEDSQILYLDFEDDTELTLNDQDIDVVDESDLEAVEGKFGGGVSFNGSSSYFVMDLIEDWNHGMNWSLAFWVKSEVVDQFTWGILGFCTYSGSPEGDYYDDEPRVGGLKLGVPDAEMAGKLFVDVSWIADAGPWEDDVPAIWDDGDWHHFVITYSADGEMMMLYIDNQPYLAEPAEMAIAADFEVIKTEEGFTEASIEDDNLKIGTAGIGWTEGEDEEYPENMYFNGMMDDIRLFNIALSLDEVAEIYNYAPTGISDLKVKGQLEIYPNPASGHIKVSSPDQIFDLNFYNSLGQVVMSKKGIQSGSMVSIDGLEPGLYFVKSGESAQKLIVE